MAAQRFQPLKELPRGRHSIYQVISDSQNNLWMAEFTHGYIGKIDAKTGKATWYPLPTASINRIMARIQQPAGRRVRSWNSRRSDGFSGASAVSAKAPVLGVRGKSCKLRVTL